jgi:hypothetical protein
MTLANLNLSINNPGVVLIGVMGQAGTGKDTVANILFDVLTEYVGILHLAGPVKDAAAAKFGVNRHYFDMKKHEVDPFWGITYRAMAQWEGTEATRETASKILGRFGNDFWLLANKKRIEESDYEVIVIPDVRFQNEYEYIVRNKGCVIDLSGSPSRGKGAEGGIQNHASEKLEIDCYAPSQTYKIFNGGSYQDLLKKVTELAPQLLQHKLANV